MVKLEYVFDSSSFEFGQTMIKAKSSRKIRHKNKFKSVRLFT